MQTRRDMRVSWSGQRNGRTRRGGVTRAATVKTPIYEALKGKKILRTSGERVEVTSLWNEGGGDGDEKEDIAVLVFMRSFG